VLYTRLTNLNSKRGYFGIVTTRGQSGEFMRRLAFPVNRNTKPQSQWRANFATIKRLWQSLGSGGAGYVPQAGVYPQDAWSIANELFNGVLYGPLLASLGYVEGIQSNCIDGEAFYVMCQTSATLLGLPPYPTPVIIDTGLTVGTITGGGVVSGYDFTCSVELYPPAQPLGATLGIQVTVAGNVTDTCAASIAGLPAGVTATFTTNPDPFVYYSGPNVSQAGFYLTLTMVPNAAIATATATLNLHCTGASSSFSIPLTISTITSRVGIPPATFALLLTFACQTLYDLSYNVVGFALTCTWANDFPTPLTWFGAVLYGVWEFLASDQYTDPYSPPDVSTWVPILFYGPFLPTPAALLEAWVAQYGPLDSPGYIKFQACYIDTQTGATGDTLSCTASWEFGTLKGGTIFGGPPTAWGWNGGLYQFIGGVWTLIDEFTITAPGSYVLATYISGVGAFTGTITLTPKSLWIVPTGHNSTAYAFPAGVALAISPNPVSLSPGTEGPVLVTFTITVDSNYQTLGGSLSLYGTDGIKPHSFSPVLSIENGNLPVPPVAYVTLSPFQFAPGVLVPDTIVVPYYLFNTDVNEYSGVMQVSFSNPSMSGAFDNVNPTVPAQSFTYLEFANPILLALGVSVSGTTVTVYVNGVITGSMVGWFIELLNTPPEGFPSGPFVVTANTFDSFTFTASGFATYEFLFFLVQLLNTNGEPTTPNDDYLITIPGYVNTNLTITVPAGTELNSADNAQVAFSAGVDTAYAALFL
jgi:hypothetical protein